MTPAPARSSDQPANCQTLTLTGNMGVILLDGEGRIIAENRRARNMLLSEENFIRLNGMLSAINGYATELKERIDRVLRQQNTVREFILMNSHSDRLPIALTVQCYRYGRAAVAIVIADPNQDYMPDVELLRTLYGLTSAEIRVASALAGCRSIAETAAAQKMALHTVRTHLKSLFQKTGCHRQSELVALLLNTPAQPEILL